MGVEVKICGITRPSDAAAAREAGADWLGVVFAGGPRVVSVERAASIVTAAGDRPVLGVFGAQHVATIPDLCRRARLAGAQLHGNFVASDAAALRRAGLTVWRVVRLSGVDDLARLDEPWMVDAILVEPLVPHGEGGSGLALSTGLARAARTRLAARRMVLAGGLRPDSVAAAVGLVAPDVVDVSSGVESLPGIKDESKIARFVEAARGRSAVR
ncbi:MAG TPA: phosphoribosylanthranilate isomerase [Gemmatimonadales bacterium]|nr:phosphoribosylanthranilate isomerase [Gemmatimonadales bacterium]